MKDLQNDFYYILERFGNRSYICGANSKSKTKTGIKTFEEKSRGMERDKEKLKKLWEELNERVNQSNWKKWRTV